ncbi:MAG TPA: hypothetical protein HA262_16290 [Methanosarcina sp.]|jgi:hypothetical protein|nr:hypothetical protein [Methanosarcina sp.]
MSSSTSGKLISWAIPLSPNGEGHGNQQTSTNNVISKIAEKGLLKIKAFPKDGGGLPARTRR